MNEEMNEILETAEDVGRAIQKTSVYENFSRLKERLSEEPELIDLYQRFVSMAGKLSDMQAMGMTPAKPEIEALKEMKEEVMEKELLRDFWEASSLYLSLMEEVQRLVTDKDNDS